MTELSGILKQKWVVCQDTWKKAEGKTTYEGVSAQLLQLHTDLDTDLQRHGIDLGCPCDSVNKEDTFFIAEIEASLAEYTLYANSHVKLKSYRYNEPCRLDSSIECLKASQYFRLACEWNQNNSRVQYVKGLFARLTGEYMLALNSFKLAYRLFIREDREIHKAILVNVHKQSLWCLMDIKRKLTLQGVKAEQVDLTDVDNEFKKKKRKTKSVRNELDKVIKKLSNDLLRKPPEQVFENFGPQKVKLAKSMSVSNVTELAAYIAPKKKATEKILPTTWIERAKV